MFRDITPRYDLDRMRTLSLEELERHLVDELTTEIRRSPDGLAIRYPSALYQLLSSHLPTRYTLVNILGTTDLSTLVHLKPRESVTLWLIESLAGRHLAFDSALSSKLIHVTTKDNSTRVRVELSWDTSQIALHDAI